MMACERKPPGQAACRRSGSQQHSIALAQDDAQDAPKSLSADISKHVLVARGTPKCQRSARLSHPLFEWQDMQWTALAGAIELTLALSLSEFFCTPFRRQQTVSHQGTKENTDRTYRRYRRPPIAP
jgi:hypothetical protein